MTENVRGEQGREWFIPPCVAEIRVASDRHRTDRNADFRTRTSRDFQLISYGQGYDGGMLVTCIGKEECAGGVENVDRHDLQQDKMPETTAAMRGICTARKMFCVSRPGFLTTHEVVDD